jgi:hypothetical protein
MQSKRFLSVSGTELATQERENMRVMSILNGDSYSSVSIMPRVNNSDGAFVNSGFECCIRVNERTGEFLRCAKGATAGNKTTSKLEVNCSLEKSIWSINVYKSAKEFSGMKVITAGKPISLSCSETFSFLAINDSEIESDIIDPNATASAYLKPPVLISDELDYHVGVGSMWRAEKKNVSKGGPFMIGQDKMMLRHMNTGMYLHSKKSDGTLIGVRDRVRAGEFNVNTARDSNKASEMQGTFLEEGSTITLSHTVYFGKSSSVMHIGLANGNRGVKDITTLRASSELASATDLIASGAIHSKHDSDIYFGIDANRCIINFRVTAGEVGPDDAFDSPNMILASQAYKSLVSCMEQLCEFLDDMHIKARNERQDHGFHSFGISPETSEKLTARQSMIREQGVLDSIMDILEECIQRKFDTIKASISGFGSSNVGSLGHRQYQNKHKGGHAGGHTAVGANRGTMNQGANRITSTDKNKSAGGKPMNRFQTAALGFSASPKMREKIEQGSDSDSEDGEHHIKSGNHPSILNRVSSIFSSSKSNVKKMDKVDSDSDSDSSSSSSSSSSSDSDNEKPPAKSWLKNRASTAAAEKDKAATEKAKATQGALNMFGYGAKPTAVPEKKENDKFFTTFKGLLGAFGRKKDNKKTILAKNTSAATNYLSEEPPKSRRMSNAGATKRVSMHQRGIGAGAIMLPSALGKYAEASSVTQGQATGKKRGAVSDELSDIMLRSLLKCIHDHQGNQVYISDRISILLMHVHKQEFAVSCLQELLRANETILQTKIGQEEINIFIDLLVQSPMNVTFLQLMQSTCTSRHGIDSTQRMVAYALWGDSDGSPPPYVKSIADKPNVEENAPDPGRVAGGTGGANLGLMVNMFMKYPDGTNRGIKRTWVHPGYYSYFPDQESKELDEDQTGILGFGLLMKGMPNVNVNWYDPAPNQSRGMLKLFGARDEIPFTLLTSVHIKNYINSVKLRELNRDAAKNQKGGDKTRRASSGVSNFYQMAQESNSDTIVVNGKPQKLTTNDEFRVQVAEYMLAELHLVADLCLDRNYVAIRILEKCYPYDMLVSVLLDEAVAPQFKAPVCRILRCLWIDREPQIAAVFPRLIRSSKSADDPTYTEQDDFSKHHKGSPYSFCLLQQVIIDYYRQSFESDECDELSAEMSEMLHMLINFGFYSKKEQLEDVIRPLMQSLDHAAYLQFSASSIEQIDKDRIYKEHLKRVVAEKKAATVAATLESDDFIDEKQRRRSSGGAVLGSLTRMLSFNGKLSASGRRNPRKGKGKVVPLVEGKKIESGESGDEQNDLDALQSDRVHYKTHRQMLAAKRKDDAEKNASLHTLEGKFLSFTESTYGMMVLMIVVLVSVVISILNVVDRDRYAIEAVVVTDLACSVLFMAELLGRIISVVRVREGGLIPYFMDPINLLDLALVVLDVVILAIGSNGSNASAGKIARFARVIRFFRMLRIMRVLRLMKILANVQRSIESYVLPSRYSEITPSAGRTYTAILRSINLIYRRIQDNSLEMVIQGFQEWVKLEQQGEIVDARQVITRYLENDDSLGLIPPGFDMVLADLIMYEDKDLADEALHLLMVHKNRRHILLSLSKDIQIVYSPKVEKKLAEAKQALQSMRRIAEMYEIWQGLNTPEDLSTHAQLNKLIQNMIILMKKINDEKTLAVKREYIPDEEVQNLLRNLDAMTCFMTVLEALYDGGREEAPEAIKETMRSCMTMVSLFVLENPRNQALAYDHMYFFVERVDDGLNSSQVVRSILEGNSDIIKRAHKRCTDEFAQKIFSNGRKPEYMEMFLGLTSSTAETFDGGMRPVHNNISRYLTSREWQARILLWCCQNGSAGYTKRAAEMNKCAPEPGKFVANEELSAELRYHIYLLEVLASCSLGPKLQAIYQFDDIVSAIIDNTTLFNVRIALGRCMEQVVANGAAHFIGSESMWQFLDYLSDYLQTLQTQMDRIFRRPYSTDLVVTKSQIGDWLEICLNIVTYYFQALDLGVFGEILYHDVSIKHTQRVESDILGTIRNLYNSIRVFMERFPLYTGTTISERGNLALVSLAKHSETINYNYDGPDANMPAKRTQRASVTLADVQQLQLRHKFAEFTTILQEVDLITHDESITFFMSMPTLETEDDSRLNVESFVMRLMQQLKGYIKYGAHTRVLGGHLQESIWLIRTLRRLFEKMMNKSIEFTVDLDMDQCESNALTEKWRDIFIQCGVTRMCIEFIAVGMDPVLQLESINLLVVMLAKRGGASSVQEEAYRVLKEADSTLFFMSFKEILSDVLMWYQKESEGVTTLAEDDHSVMVLPDETILLTLIQLLCEGDFVVMKNYMREQEGNRDSVNIPQILCQILDFLSRKEAPLFTHVSITLVKTIRALIHGPCKENQRYLVVNTEVFVCINRLMRSSRPKTQALTVAWNRDMEVLKACIVDLLRSAVEGSTSGSYIFDRIISSIELNVLSLLLMPSTEEDHDVMEYGFTHTEAKYMVFLSTLEAPGSMDTLSNATLMKRDMSIGFAEIRWQKSTHKVYFHKPKILEDLSKDYIQEFHDIDAASQEDKMVVFLAKVRALYIEAKHQQLLTQYGLSYLWARRRTISWFLFTLAATLNIMLLVYYKRDYKTHLVIFSEAVEEAFTGLLIIQIITSLVMAILYITVRMPSKYLSHIDNGSSTAHALIQIVMDPLPVWYSLLFTLSILSFTWDKIFCAIFLLEFVVLDGTTQYLLKAVSLPFWNLMATFVILAIAIHIFSGAYFELFSYDLEHNHVEPIYDLWSSFKLALTYGLRGEYGVDHEFYVTIGPRMWLDLAFYFIILAILRHIFFAIIVETFGQLREEKNEREEKGHNSCFICGVARHDYEKLGLASSFQEHRNDEHNPENYVSLAFAVMEQQKMDDLGVEMFVRKCMTSRDRWESISWIPIGVDKMYAMRQGAAKGATGPAIESLELIGDKSKKSHHRDDSENKEDGDDPRDNGRDDDGGDDLGRSSPSIQIKQNTWSDEDGDRKRMTRISSFSVNALQGSNFGGGQNLAAQAQNNKVMTDLSAAIGQLSNQMASISSRLDGLEQNQSSFGVIGSSGGSNGSNGNGLGSRTAPPNSPPYMQGGTPLRQPLPSRQHRHQQLTGPTVDLAAATGTAGTNSSTASGLGNMIVASASEPNAGSRSRNPSTDDRGDETKELD